ncbi:MAG: DUF4058 family protein [Roseiflexaceae bacterium]
MARSPFPGMDPYLEGPTLWPDVHSSLMTIFREQLTPLLVPKYVAELNTQIVIDSFGDIAPETESVLPDVTITQSRLLKESGGVAVDVAAPPLRRRVPMSIPTRLVTIYIRQRENEKLVTVIELLSPVNKRPGEGRRAYVEKRNTFLSTPVGLVEIDLLRRWPRMPLEGKLPASDYLAIVCNMYERPECGVWPLSVRRPLPKLPIPLLRPDPPVELDITQALQTAYERARYDLRIDYHAPCDPPLTPADTEWAATLIAQAEDSPH